MHSSQMTWNVTNASQHMEVMSHGSTGRKNKTQSMKRPVRDHECKVNTLSDSTWLMCVHINDISSQQGQQPAAASPESKNVKTVAKDETHELTWLQIAGGS